MDELRNSGQKFNEEDFVMVTKTKKDELVFISDDYFKQDWQNYL